MGRSMGGNQTTVSSLKIICFTKNPRCAFLRSNLLIIVNKSRLCSICLSFFVYNEEFKGGIQGYSLCLLANQSKLQLLSLGCKRWRTNITSIQNFEADPIRSPG